MSHKYIYNVYKKHKTKTIFYMIKFGVNVHMKEKLL